MQLQAGPVRLAGHLTIPEHPAGVVVFAHGSSSRHSPRNRFVAAILNRAGLSTLLFDLLTPEEDCDRTNVFDIELLARRLVDVTGWLRAQPGTRGLPSGASGPAPAPSPRSGLPLTPPMMWRPWYPAAAAPTSPGPSSGP